MDILDPQKWMPMIQASVEALLVPFEAMAQRLITFTIPLLEVSLAKIIGQVMDRLETKTLPLLTAELTTIATNAEDHLIADVDALVTSYTVGVSKK